MPTLMNVAARAVRLAAIRRGDAVLDLGTGTGLAAFIAAAQAGPDAPVVGVDASADMLAIAAERARLAGLQQVRWRTGEAHRLDFAHESFDVVACIHLLHDLARPDEALAEMHRIVAPGGRVSLVVWGRASANPWEAVLRRAVAPVLATAPWPEPGPFSLGSPGVMELLLQHTGFVDIECERIRDRLRWESVDDLWQWHLAWPRSGPMLAVLTPEQQASVRRQLDRLVGPYRGDGELMIPRELVYARALVPPD